MRTSHARYIRQGIRLAMEPYTPVTSRIWWMLHPLAKEAYIAYIVRHCLVIW